jgi:putative nucleotidyltransferase-like protein
MAPPLPGAAAPDGVRMREKWSLPPQPVQRDILALLRGETPPEGAPPPSIDETLRRYECGGYLNGLWTRNGRASALEPGWTSALARSHRKTAIDTLAALGELRRAGRILTDAGIPFLLLKGAAYLVDLYEDPAERVLTDVDLLIRRSDAGRAARRLSQEGFRPVAEGYRPEYRRFEMERPGPDPCRIELHFRVGMPLRARVDQNAIWRRAVPCSLEGIGCGRLHPEDAILYHAAHLADHYYGPSLKWAIDLREMLRRWRPDAGALLERSAAWRTRTALHLALLHVAKLFPDDAPPVGLLAGTAPGRLRRALLSAHLSGDPLALFVIPEIRHPRRYLLRLLMVDRAADAAGLGVAALLRPVLAAVRRALGRDDPPWEWSD